MTEQDFIKITETEEFKAIVKLTAYVIKKTPTEKDDEIAKTASKHVSLIAKIVEEVSSSDPSDKEAKEAAVILLKKISSLTKTKIDDVAVVALSKFI